MQDHGQVVTGAGHEGTPDAAASDHVVENHPNALRYVQIALILAVLTAVEIAVYYIPELKNPLVPILLTLSAVKFTLVVLWYMHLKFDSKLFSALFTLGLGIAASLLLGLLALFYAFRFQGGLPF